MAEDRTVPQYSIPVYPGWVLEDFSYFDNIIENLLEKFGICRSASARRSSNLRIDVTDEGVGFGDSQLERMMLKSHRYGLFSII